VKKYDVDDQAAADPARDHVRYALEGMLNHPLAHAQLVPYESAESHQAFMKRFNQTMTLAVMFRDRPVGRIRLRGSNMPWQRRIIRDGSTPCGPAPGLCSRLAPAASSFNSPQPLILSGPEEIDTTLTLDLVRQDRIQITSGHPMGGCTLGGNPGRDVVDSQGRSWDVDGLYVADSSIFPTSLGVNPCYTVYALGRYIGDRIVKEIRASR
jgi:choline dehydrogenase-like flavoprotein